MSNSLTNEELLKGLKRKNKRNRRIELALRAWAAGAVYFFVGWGTQVSQTSIFDFGFFLAIALAVFDLFVITPIVNGMLKNERVTPKKDIKKGTLSMLKNVFKNLFIVTVLINIYNLINLFLIVMLDLANDAVPFPGEPITFGLLYLLIWLLIEGLVKSIKSKIEKEGIE